MSQKSLGKIESINLGMGGYQNAMFGLSVQLVYGGCMGCGDFKGTWGLEIKPDKNSKWTEFDRGIKFDETMRFINDLLIKAKKQNLQEMKGVPVEVTIEGGSLKSWRILEEVL